MHVINEENQLLFSLMGAIVIIIIRDIHLRKIFNKDGSKKV